MFGITFTAQEKPYIEKISSKRGKTKVTITLRWIQENANQVAVRNARVQKKMVETFSPSPRPPMKEQQEVEDTLHTKKIS